MQSLGKISPLPSTTLKRETKINKKKNMSKRTTFLVNYDVIERKTNEPNFSAENSRRRDNYKVHFNFRLIEIGQSRGSHLGGSIFHSGGQNAETDGTDEESRDRFLHHSEINEVDFTCFVGILFLFPLFELLLEGNFKTFKCQSYCSQRASS